MRRPKPTIHPLLAGASIVIILAGLREIGSVLNIFLVALLLAVTVSPLLTWQLRRGWPKWLSLTITILVVIVILGSVTSLLGVAVNNMVSGAGFYQDKVTELYRTGLDNLAARGVDISEIRKLEVFSPNKIVAYMTKFIENVFSTFGNFFFVVLLMVFILIEFADITLKADRGMFAPNSWQRRSADVTNDLKKYISINAITGLIAAVADFIILIAIGVDFAILWGFLAFLFSFIPNIGFILSVIPPAVLALIQFGWVQCVIVVVLYVLINTVVDNVVKPRYLGKEFNMSILVVFLSLLFWGWLLGAIGAILGVPLTMIGKRLWEFMNSDLDGHTPRQSIDAVSNTPAPDPAGGEQT